jgi:GNAT superfamily N-acetyltransferase
LANGIEYIESLDELDESMLAGFFEGWASRPSPKTHLRILQGSAHVVLAIDVEARRIVGFINAISDGLNSAFIPLLEVLPEYRGRGIGSQLVKRMLDVLGKYPCIDLCCDPGLQPFYSKLGMTPSVGMLIRNYGRARPNCQLPIAKTETNG